MSRPNPPDVKLNEGMEWRAVPDERWDTPSWHDRCRRKGCTNSPVVDFYRGIRGRLDPYAAYCGDHMYGHWVEDGVVLSWRVVES